MLADHNYRVTIINSNYSKQLSDEDARLLNGYPIRLISAIRLQDKDAGSVIARLMYKIGRVLVKAFNIQTSLALGYVSWKYKNIAIKQSADLYIAHQEMGLYCGVQLLKSRKKVAFDFEDWYSEDLLSDARSYRPLSLLRELEKYGLKYGVFCITTSHVMARKMADVYNVPVPFCIYNVFNKETEILNSIKEFEKPLKLFWFSQTIGPGRGLERLFELLNDLKVVLEINLLGNLVNTNYKNQLQKVSVHRLNFYSLIEAAQLPQLISQFDIGLALELNKPLNRSLTVSNKLFQYMLSGLPVIATNTPGQSEIIKNYGGGILIDYDDPEYSKTQIRQLLTSEQTLQVYRHQAITAANELCWDKQKIKLLELVSGALNE